MWNYVWIVIYSNYSQFVPSNFRFHVTRWGHRNLPTCLQLKLWQGCKPSEKVTHKETHPNWLGGWVGCGWNSKCSHLLVVGSGSFHQSYWWNGRRAAKQWSLTSSLKILYFLFDQVSIFVRELKMWDGFKVKKIRYKFFFKDLNTFYKYCIVLL